MATAAATSMGVSPRARIRPKYLIFSVIGIMMAYVMVHNESYLWNWKDPIWQHYHAIKLYLLPHGLTAMFAILLGPTQFSDRIRNRFPRYHRVAGRLFVMGAMLGGPQARSCKPRKVKTDGSCWR